MAGFESLPGAQAPATAFGEIQSSEVAFAGQSIEDATAMKLVLQDVQLAQNYVLSKVGPTDWENADNRYRAYVNPKPWPGTDVPRSNLSMPVILEAIEKLMPVLHLSFFSDKQPFLCLPLGKTSPEAARANAKVLLWAIKESGFKEEIRRCLKSWLLYGFCAAQWGWQTVPKTRKKFELVPQGEGKHPRVKKTEESYEISHPTIKQLDLRNVFFDPSLREQDCRKGGWVCAQIFSDARVLDDLREDPDYKNVPTREQLAEILSMKAEQTTDSMSGTKSFSNRELQALPQTQAGSVDPLRQPLEFLEYVTDDTVITVLQRTLVIRNQPNEFKKKNFLSAAFIDVLGSMYGFGVAKLLAGEQSLQIGVLNSWVDQLALQLNPSYQAQTGVGGGSQNLKLSPGKIINHSGELKPLARESVSAEALGAIQSSEVRATRRVGANSADYMPTQALRTAEGVNSFASDIANKLQYSIEIFSDLVFIPALEAFLEVCKDNLQPEDINRILSEDEGKAYAGDILDVYHASCNIQVLSSTKLAARRAAGQLVPLILQTASAQPMQDALTAQGKKFNYAELLAEAVDLAGWDCDSLIIDATPEEINRAMMMKAGAQKASQESQVLEQEHQNKMQEIDAAGLARAGNTVIKHVLNEQSKSSNNLIPGNIG